MQAGTSLRGATTALLIAVATACVLLGGLASVAAGDPGTKPSPSMLGINHADFYGTGGLQDASLMGARYDRLDFMPNMTQAAIDTIFTQEASQGMRVLPILLKYHVPFTTTNNSSFAQWAQTFMQRYGAGGTFWSEPGHPDPSFAPTIFEVENEVYGWWFYPDAPNNAAGYDDLFKQVVTAGRQINPNYRFLFSAAHHVYTQGGQDAGIWANMVTAADPTIGNYIDGLVVHPYGVRDVNNGWGYGATRAVHDGFAAVGISRPVYITEVGLCTSPTATPADRCGIQANQATAIDYWFNDFRATPWIYALVIYQYRDPGDLNLDPSNAEYWYGLVDRFGGHKAGWSAYKAQALQTP